MIEKNHFLSKKIEELERKLELLKSVESEEEYFKKMSKKQMAYRKTQLKENKKKSMDTIALWGLYGKRDMDQYKSYIPPIYATTAGAPLKSLEYGKLLLAYEILDDPNKMYSRIDNITVDHLAHKIASMEGKGIPELTLGLCTSSGMSAIFMATMPFLEVGDTFVAPKLMYGGTFHLFETTYPKMGWDARWVEEPEEPENWREQIDENTKFLYAEFPTNPTLFCPDLPNLSDLAHEFDIPLIVDSTLATPILTRPLEHGADVVVHSATKMMCGSGRAIGGALISKEVITTEKQAFKEHFAWKVKEGPFRNLGPCMSPFEAKEIWDALNTLKYRVEAASQKAMKIANFLRNHPTIERVNYPGLPSHPQHEIARNLMQVPNGTPTFGNLISFQVKGGLKAAKRFAQLFDFGVMLTDLGRDYTVWVHPGSTTHAQMSEEERKQAGIPGNLIRYSVGLEGTEDVIQAFDETLRKL